MVTYSLNFREGELILAFAVAAFAVAYWSWRRAWDAKTGAWAAYEEIHSHRSATEENPHENEFKWVQKTDGSDE